MHYELYVDVLLLTDLTMNMLLLFLTGKMLRVPVRKRRITAASLTGAAGHGMCLLMLLRTGNYLVLLLSLPLAAVMTAIAFPLKKLSLFFQAMAVLFLLSFILSGLMQAANPLHRTAFRSFVLTAAAGYAGMTAIDCVYRHFKRTRGHLYPVRLYIGAKELCVTGLLDTGNRLIDPWYHKPVHILDQTVLNEFLTEKAEELRFHMIPFHSVGKDRGLLPAVIIPRMVIGTAEELEIKEAVIALAEGNVSFDHRYQMILHEECMCS